MGVRTPGGLLLRLPGLFRKVVGPASLAGDGDMDPLLRGSGGRRSHAVLLAHFFFFSAIRLSRKEAVLFGDLAKERFVRQGRPLEPFGVFGLGFLPRDACLSPGRAYAVRIVVLCCFLGSRLKGENVP